MTAYATITDLQARFPRALTASETAQADTMLEDAAFLLNVKADGLAEAVDSGDEEIIEAAKLLSVAMVRRALMAQAAALTVNPAVDSLAETFGPYSHSIKYKSPGSDLYLFDSELEWLLALLRGDDRAQAVSMRSLGL